MKNIIFSALILFVGSCTKKGDVPSIEGESLAASNTVTISKEQYDASDFELGTIENRMLSSSIQVTGMLDVPPQNLINITAPLGGFLRSTSLLQGMQIRKGQVLAVIENPEYIQLQQDYLDTKSQVEFLETEYQRQRHLSEENVNAEKVLQKSVADLASMKAKNSGLRAKLSMLNIDATSLHPENIKSTIEIRSPMEGYVTQVNTSIGAFVSPTEVMFKIVDTAHLHAELICFERDIPKIKIGQKVRFVLAHENTERMATVFLIGREINTDRTVRIHGHLDKEDRELIPGMYLKAVIETSAEMFPSLPEEAIQNFEDQQVIFIKTTETEFQLVEIKTGIRKDGFVAIITPPEINASTRVVIKNAYKMLSKLKNSESEE